MKFISKALSPESEIKFETPIAHVIPRIPTAQLIGNSLLTGCGGFSIKLRLWWHLSFPQEIVERTLQHLKSKGDPTLISINCLEYVTIIIGFCAALVSFETNHISDDPYPVVLCVTDKTSTLNWTQHTSAPWIYKLMSHLYTSLAAALRNNTEFLKCSSEEFRALIKQIYSNNYHGNESDHQRHINYALKQAAKMMNSHKYPYIVNRTMRE